MQEFRFTFLLRLTCVLICLSLGSLAVIYGSSVFFPLFFSFLIAVLLRPMVGFFERRLRMPSALAIIISEVIAFSLFLLLMYGVLFQIGRFVNDWASIQENMLTHIGHVQQWVNEEFGISQLEQNTYLKQAANKSMDSGGSVISSTLGSISNILVNLLLSPIYVFLILFYRKLLTQFLLEVFGKVHAAALLQTISSIKSVVSSYIVGLLIEMGIVATLNAGGLLLLGVRYAVLLGLISALLNLIPYIGTLLAGLLAVMVTLSSSDELSKAIGVVIIFSVVQFIDNNIVMPRIVGGKVKVNALASIVGVIVGGALGGVAGMFLAIPTLAILKVIFDNSVGMKPWGLVLGDDIPHAPLQVGKIVKLLQRISVYPTSAPVPNQETANPDVPPES